ncbi:carbohydrate-binding protein [Desulfoscipio gibsoniae]|uniref:Carbohydrate binding domain (Family 25) n=1 Tax=Desulfoscipio gibsoniae DSM 7213 TaxID=767817 RepID=R4KQE9_9FIRM|nr:carbohydrate-binding protein [Desulfoscipio gibsoniae]AGL01866.1 Carbohydrate binding domain (family 25) [Desulfoscipio gibsoniae DSM 7213]
MANPTNFGSGEYKLKAMHEARYPGGVVVDPTPITSGEEITVLYDGLLAASGATQIYLHVGYGDARDWRNIKAHRMSKTGWGWVKTLEMPDDSRFNFCFHDGYGNWDNNNGLNWSFEIHNGRRH